MALVQKIEDIEAEIARTQVNKATMSHLCQLRAKVAKYKREILADPKGGGGGPGEGFDVRATGDARVGFVGFPSVGKSTLLTSLTDVQSEAASYEFTTLTCIPGIKFWKGAKMQLLDLPGIIEGARDGKGRGRQVIAVARTCSCLIIVLDALKDIQQKKIIEKELEGVGIRLNKKPPEIKVEKKVSGGINYAATVRLTHLDEDSIKAILTEYRIMSATVRINCDATADDLIDAIEGNRVYMPCVYALNKIDAITMEELDILDAIPHYCPISSHYGWNLDGLMDMVFEYLNMTRVYTKPKGQMPDYDTPVIIRGNVKPTVEIFCKKIHRQLINDFKYGWVWGKSVKFNPQKVGKAHVLMDEDVLQIVKKI
mmetsp:Transcript_15706/g.51293  ORF Transcript_15706/g.51293 Transcript_15706/m.51293 type:complete len:369 (-) Transcript_15706:631-1737(-)